MRKLSLFLVLLVVSVSCSVEKKAGVAFRNGEYQTSIDLYKTVLEKEAGNSKANMMMGEAYRQSNRVGEGAPYYEKAFNRIQNDSIALNYALALKANARYDEAIKVLESGVGKIEDEKYKKRAEDELQNLVYLENLKDKKSFFRVKNLAAINSEAAEYSPVYFDGALYFTSSRETSNKIYKGTGTPFTNIYKVKTKGAKVDQSSLQGLGGAFNNPNINEGSVTFTPDGKTMVFARGNSGKKKGRQDVDLYISRYRNNEWSEPQLISGKVNVTNAWDSSPAFSRDGKTLYFASNRKGGNGGTDIYSAKMNSRGRFFKIKNLGPNINTTGNEMFPYISDDGHMYFSSDGHPGYGGLDMFIAKRSNGRTHVENMGQPVNSVADDFGMFLFKPDRGFFTSNRQGGSGDDDIYTFVNEDPNLKIVNYYLKGITMTRNEKDSLIVLPNTEVQLLDFKGQTLEEVKSNQKGEFQFRVYEHEHYNLIGEKETTSEITYFKTRVLYTTVGKSVPQEELTKLVTNVYFDTLMVLEQKRLNKRFVLDNIYYDLDESKIRDDAGIELDKLAQLLVDNPDIKIELSSHTDSRAPDDYNDRLSQRRAQAAVDYLILEGIDPDRLIAKGYGEQQPFRATAANVAKYPILKLGQVLTESFIESIEDEFLQEEIHQINRRTEFKILEVDKSKLKAKPTEEEEENESEDDTDRFFDDSGDND